MNRYSLDSDSRRWWWPSATAGALGTAAVTALFVLPASHVGAAPAAPAPTGTTTSVDRPCFIFQAHWNTGLDGPQPVCTTEVTTPPVTPAMRAPGRPVFRTLDYLP